MAKKRGGATIPSKSKNAAPKDPKAKSKPPKAKDKPAVAENEKRLDENLKLLAQHGVSIGSTTYQKLPDAQLREVNKWCDTVRGTDGKTVPQLPKCLEDYASRTVQQKDGPVPAAPLPPRKFMACRFGGVSKRDGVIGLPVRVNASALTANEARELLVGRKCEILIALQSNGDANQKQLFDGADLDIPRIECQTLIKGVAMKPEWYDFRVTFAEDDCDFMTAGKFDSASGRIEVQVLGNSKSEGNGHSVPLPHPDVEAGKDRPHGTPLLDKLAEAQREKDAATSDPASPDNSPTTSEHAAPADEFAEGLDEPDTIPMPQADPADKLYLCQPQLAESLKLICVETVPLADIFGDLDDEQRDEIDTWAKVVACHVAGDKSIELPPTPQVIALALPKEQRDNPVGFAERSGGYSRLQWYCVRCDYDFPASKPRRCPDCDAAKDEDVILVGFYGEPCVTFDGRFVGPDVDTFQVLPSRDDVYCKVHAVQGSDKKWRGGIDAELLLPDGLKEHFAVWPSILSSGHETKNAAIASRIGTLIDDWSSLPGELAEETVCHLKEYLDRIQSGADPLELEHALPDADGFGPDDEDDGDDE